MIHIIYFKGKTQTSYAVAIVLRRSDDNDSERSKQALGCGK
jgi:hypothetical protein